MHREIATDSDQLERFRREARAVAQLSHPHIVGVIDDGEDEGRPYIVFEYVEGETLKERIRRIGRARRLDEAVAYAIEIARALGGAHARHIVHRDVKPQNVLIDEEGAAKVTDFGIARSLDDDGLTADGRVLGTTDYVSPEQALGHDVTGQSDLYSLGIVLYEMLTGDVPFHGENQVSVAMKHVREELPDVQTLRPEVSATLGGRDRPHDREGPRTSATARRATLIADLEDVLAIEAARSGSVDRRGDDGAAHAAEPCTQRRVPLRVRSRPAWMALAALLIVVALVSGIVLLGDRTHRGTGTEKTSDGGGAVTPVGLHSNAAHDYDPLGDGTEHADQTALRDRRQPHDRVDDRVLLDRRPAEGRRRPRARRDAGRGLPRAAREDADAGVRRRRLRRERRLPSLHGSRRRLEAGGDRRVRLLQADDRPRHRRPESPLGPPLDHQTPARRRQGRDQRAVAVSLRPGRLGGLAATARVRRRQPGARALGVPVSRARDVLRESPPAATPPRSGASTVTR